MAAIKAVMAVATVPPNNDVEMLNEIDSAPCRMLVGKSAGNVDGTVALKKSNDSVTLPTTATAAARRTRPGSTTVMPSTECTPEPGRDWPVIATTARSDCGQVRGATTLRRHPSEIEHSEEQ